ncbi:hypothetical protein BC830DRAFT_1148670 [Chytriomyces sp. MP71]|nr:hypothetical protein BC830DRAFT_1148670 [Chytriomyces sp. MP71]
MTSDTTKPLLRWHPMSRRSDQAFSLPADALPLGRDTDGALLFAARAVFPDSGVQVGKFRSDTGCHISYGGSVHTFLECEVLCGCVDALLWMETEHALRAETIVGEPAGHEADGIGLFVAVYALAKAVFVGKCSIRLGACSYAVGDEEAYSNGRYFVVFCDDVEGVRRKE